ncbi:MAG: TonB-dependent receptor [Myxococcota bacterium]
MRLSDRSARAARALARAVFCSLVFAPFVAVSSSVAQEDGVVTEAAAREAAPSEFDLPDASPDEAFAAPLAEEAVPESAPEDFEVVGDEDTPDGFEGLADEDAPEGSEGLADEDAPEEGGDDEALAFDEDESSTPVAFDDPSVEEMVIRSTRASKPITEVSRSAVVLEGERLQVLLDQTTSLQEVLGKSLPGLAPPSTEGSADSLTLRGRNPLFLLDGIPIAPNTNFGRFLDKFDPLTIDRIEVVYGPTALYGAGATGGVVQFFTKEPTDRTVEVSTGVQTRMFIPNENAFDSDGISTKVNLSVSSKPLDWLSFYVYGSYEDARGAFRSAGDVLTSRSSFSDDFTLFGKVKLEPWEDQSIVATANFTRLIATDRRFEFEEIDAGDGTRIGVASGRRFTYEVEPVNEFVYASLQYRHEDLFGGELSLLGYFSDSEFLNDGSDIRDLAIFTGWPPLFQSGRENTEFGFRADYQRQFFDRFDVSLGLDYNDVDNKSILVLSSLASLDNNARWDGQDPDAEQTPPYELEALGIFVQTTIDVTDELSITGGVRWDRFEFDIEGPYDVIFAFPGDGGLRPGGGDFATGFSYNVGATYQLDVGFLDSATLFANYSQGFTIPSLGFSANEVPAGVPIEGSDLINPVITDSVEAGFRSRFLDFQLDFAAYYSTSDDLVTTFSDITNTFDSERVPIRTYGAELTATWFVTDSVRLDGSFTWVEGEQEENPGGIDGPGDFIARSTRDVPPIKVFLLGRWDVTEQFGVFSQLTFVDRREDAADDSVDPFPSNNYTLVDIGMKYEFEVDRMPVLGGGTVSFQITNLFNKEHIPPGEITLLAGRVSAGLGRAMTLTYQHTF